ncbi:MAG: AmmeMemoRadiSam system radical SAM enzyme [Candidatus Diapherotrites archaeon]|nr:AmmeMemoRadiSam system radical SAM enzyme [Candidatus Diapherotrites archaeon]
MKEAYLYKKLKDKAVQCSLCNRRCKIPEGGRGNCQVRENIRGTLYAMTYAKPCSVNTDPIEKKPLFHFLPGTETLSIATVGCNLHCQHCQNWEISQAAWEAGPQREVPPSEVVRLAGEYKTPSISYTYTEPTIFYEYAKDTSVLAHKQKIKNVFVTNGYMTKEMLKDYKELDAANVDVKGNEEFYKKVCGGVEMQHVLDSIKRMKRNKTWVEVTNLIIPGQNDDNASILQISEFVHDLDPNMPLHFSAFFPAYKMRNTNPTPRETLVKAREIALESGVKYVYCGNTYPGDPFENTHCPNCGEALIKRHGFALLESHVDKGKCHSCGQKIAGVFK